jgi:hypothetical protein
MTARRLQEPMCFTRGKLFYQIARAYGAASGYIGICNGRVVARGAEPGAVARELFQRIESRSEAVAQA